MRRTPALLAFVAWTLFVWAVRIRNAEGSVGAVLLSLTFVLPAVAVLVRPAVVLRPLVAWTVAVWAVRIVDIVLLSDHGAGFKAVHAVLGVVSVALGAAALGATGSRAPGPGARGRRRAAASPG